MVDFISSFNEGLAQARQTENNNQEIEHIFSELNEQIGQATTGKVLIFTSLGAMTPQGLGEDLLAKNSKEMTFKLASLVRGPYGYPVTLRTRYEETFCENKEALEFALADLLKSHDTGKKLLSLMSERA